MKSKNLLLAMAAFMFAIGSAVAFSFLPQNVFVKARLVQNGPIKCVDTGKQCEATGLDICKVQIPTSVNGGSQTAQSTGPRFTYKSDCATILKNINSDLQVSTVQTWEVISE